MLGIHVSFRDKEGETHELSALLKPKHNLVVDKLAIFEIANESGFKNALGALVGESNG